MRLPRQDTSMSLPAEDPRAALLRDEALLDSLSSATSPRVRWWIASSPAVVVGLGLRHRLSSIVDTARCREAGVAVLERRAGGGALLLDEHMLCGAVCVPRASVPDDVTESYRWLGDLLASRLRSLGMTDARRIGVDEARADVAALKSRKDEVAKILLTTCYGALSPHEVAIGNAKLVGLAQIRRRHAALFQFGILLRDQSPLADFLHVSDEATRADVREELHCRTGGIDSSALPNGLDSLIRLNLLPPLPETSSEPDEFLQWPR
jgi:lipoate-protein ligase A